MTLRAGSDRSTRPAVAARLLPDERLAQRASNGEERAFAAIYQRYGQSLYRFCISILGNAEDARDALQNTMVKALQSLPGEERQIRLKPWLYRVAHNESIELLRKRRDTVPVDPELAAPGGGPAETAAQRERLRQLLRDLAELPERQRSMLVMRELGGLEPDQIGEAFGTSPAVVRQTVYEARLGLRQLAEGREMRCEEVMRRLSDADGRVRRRRDLQAHLRACPDCRAFSQAIEERKHDLTALAPLPAIASAGILHAVLGGGHGAASGTAAGITVAAGAGKVAATPALLKSVAAVAVVATVGASTADRSGLVDVGLPGGKGGTAAREATSRETVDAAGESAPAAVGHAKPTGGESISDRHEEGPADAADQTRAGSGGHGPQAALPQASEPGQQTAAAHKAEPGSHPSPAHSHPPVLPHAKGTGHPHGPNVHSHRGASHSHGGASKSHKGLGGTAAGETQAQPGGGKQEKASPSGRATGASTEQAAPVGNKSNAGGVP